MNSFSGKELESLTIKKGKKIFSLIKKEETSFFRASWWESEIIKWCLSDEWLKNNILRFVDVYPVLNTPRKLVTHLKEYFPEGKHRIPVPLRIGVGLSSAVTKGIISRMTEEIMLKIAGRFIAGRNIENAEENIAKLIKKNLLLTLDILGEATVSEDDAEKYMESYVNLIGDIYSKGITNDINVSLKLSSFYPHFEPAAYESVSEAVKEKLRPVLRLAKSLNAFVNVDIEQFYTRDISYKIFTELIEESEFTDFEGIGTVVQAYLKDSEAVLRRLIDWARSNKKKITIRLVKGAYWDYETITAKQKGWEIPVFTEKELTDIQFEKLALILLENIQYVKPAFASHNIRSIAKCVAASEMLDISPSDIEFQMLFGMGDQIKEAVARSGYRVRVYTPIGELIPGMGYLVRRILENSANESFLLQSFTIGKSEDELLKNPADFEKVKKLKKTEEPYFINEPETDFSKLENISKMKDALNKIRGEFRRKYPIVIGSRRINTKRFLFSQNPSDLKEIVGKVSKATTSDAKDAIKEAREAFAKWRNTDAKERVSYLLKAKEIMAKKKFELAAIEVYEAGKNWKEAMADVDEAIDYLAYYGQEMLKLSNPLKMDVAGETNRYVYKPRGVALVISPWNFPLAILTGMTSAAIAAGNSAIIKPSKETPVIGYKLFEIFEEAGLPKGVLNYLPGSGEEIGDFLVKHPDITVIAFTGSNEVGLRINRLIAESSENTGAIKRFIAEMGGKNAIIVDDTADIDDAVKGVITSAFGYQGQKCSAASRIIVHEDIYYKFLEKLTEAVRSLNPGHPEDPSYQIGPVINTDAVKKITGAIKRAEREGELIYKSDVSERNSCYVPVALFADIPVNSCTAQEEIFGPVLAIFKVKDFDEALETANSSKFALTGGLYSRTPSHIIKAKNLFQAGNLYINRKITGAIVGRQPFGGYKMSGIGSKAGGPDYLIQFMIPVTITENIMRHGYAGEDSE